MSESTLNIDVNKSMYRMLVDSALKNMDKVALYLGETRITYVQLIDYIDEMAYIFTKQGITKDDTVALFHNGMPATIISIYALNKIGAKVAMINALAQRKRFITATNRNNCKFALMSKKEFQSLHEFIKETPIKTVIITKFQDYFEFTELFNFNLIKYIRKDNLRYKRSSVPTDVKVLFLDKLLKEYIKALPNESELINLEHKGDPEEDALYFYYASAITDQSTACVSSKAVNTEVMIGSMLFEFEGDNTQKRVLSFVDKAYTFGFIFGIHMPLVLGHIICMCNANTTELPDAEINYYKPNILIGYPSVINKLIDNRRITKETIQQIKRILSGGDLFGSRLLSKFRDFLNENECQGDLYQLYGITETLSAVTYNCDDLNNERALGLPLPGISIKVVEPRTLNEVPVGVKGEICVLTSAYINGYFNDDDSTVKLFRNYPDGRRWVLTGDMGHMDEEGILYFDGNRKRCGEVNGAQVYPHVIESEIESVYGVKDCCVVLCPNENGDNEIIAVVVPDDSLLFDNERLQTLKNSIELDCSLVFADYMCPSDIEFRAYIPKGSYGKFDWYELTKSVREYRLERKQT